MSLFRKKPKKIEFSGTQILLAWLPLAALATIMSGLVYWAVQQNYRQSANDPQIQMAEDTAAQLRNGQSPESLVSTAKVDIGSSLAPYLIIFDNDGNPVAGSAELDGHVPSPPIGVFTGTKKAGESIFSWEPKVGVRSAAVLQHYNGNTSGFVLAGRSLREVENREAWLTAVVVLAWLAAIVSTLVTVVFAYLIKPLLS